MFRHEMIRAERENFGFYIQRSFDRIYSTSAKSLVLLLLFGCQALSMGKIHAQEYKDPDFEVAVFDEDAISLHGSDRVIVVEALAALASNFPQNGLVDMELRQKALALALRLDSLNASARSTRRLLLSGRKPVPTNFFQKLLPIHNTLWTHALAMKKSQELEDQRLYPLLMELALVINPDAKLDAPIEYAVSIDATKGRLTEWKEFVHLNDEEKSKSAIRAENILKRGRAYASKIGEMLVLQQAQAKAALAAAKSSGNSPSIKSLPVNDDAVMPKSGDQIVGTSAEAKVITWWRLGRMDVPMRLGKVMLNVRQATPADADLFGNREDDSMSSQSMRIVAGNGIDVDKSWISYSYSVAKDRHRNYPRGSVAEVSFALLGNQTPPPEARRVPGGQAIGTLLALENIINNVALDPSVAVHGILDGQKIRAGFGNLSDAVDIARKGNLRLLVVSDEMEYAARDWIALGYLDRLLDPQIVAVSNIDEMVLSARSDKSAEISEAIELFSEIKDIKTMSLEEAAKNAVVQQRLEAITTQFPQHLSAKMLLAYGKEGDGLKASLSGSMVEIFSVLKPFMERYDTAMVESEDESNSLIESSDQAETRLKDLRDRVAEEARAYLGASEKAMGELVSFLRVTNKTSASALKKRESAEEAIVEMNDEYRALRDKVEQEQKQRRDGAG